MPSSVLTSEMQSAPASSTACAISAMLLTFGESFTISGRRLGAGQARVTAAADSASSANRRPPARDVRAGDVQLQTGDPVDPIQRGGEVPKSSIDSPAMLAITGTSQRAQIGALSATTPRRPMFCRPIAFNIPAGVSAIRGVALPARGRA